MLSRLMNVYGSHQWPTKQEGLLCYNFLVLFLRHSRLPRVVHARSNLFRPAGACSWSFYFLQVATSPNILTYKGTSNQLHVRFYDKRGQALLQSVDNVALMYLKGMASFTINWDCFFYYKTGKVVLQTRACITKQGSFYFKVDQLLLSEATFITKRGRYYKEEQLLQRRVVQSLVQKQQCEMDSPGSLIWYTPRKRNFQPKNIEPN